MNNPLTPRGFFIWACFYFFTFGLLNVDGRIIGKTQVVSEENRPKNNQNKWFDFEMEIEEISGKEDDIIFQTETSMNIWGSFLMNTVRLEKN